MLLLWIQRRSLSLVRRIMFAALKHTTKKLSSGGKVVVLDTGAVIGPEAEAMIQALHSRSVGGVLEHLATLAKKGAKRFMASFYVGYGHKSIGDCGSITLFIEGVSMLAAKAVQDWALYSGQEASTRYIDFAKQPFINPEGTDKGNAVLEAWRTFYMASMEPLKEDLVRRFPKPEDEKQSVYNKAIAARAFDILRGFLPAGASTNLAWHGNMRQVADKLAQLRHHPLTEVVDIAAKLEEALLEAHPSSFGHKRYDATEAYMADWMSKGYYFTHPGFEGVEFLRDGIDRELLEEYRPYLEGRPAKTELPKQIAECGTISFGFMLDFGSFRDLQRHRAVTQRMPLVTTRHGFSEWYLSELPAEMRKNVEQLLTEQEKAIVSLSLTPEEAQYYIAMGFELPNRVTGDLPAWVYLVELRATRFVHPTLRVKASSIAEILNAHFADGSLKIHLDHDADRFDTKRGTHDIVQKD
jgi:thymidylate synthase ThyX